MHSELIMILSSVGNEQLLGPFTLRVKSSKRGKTKPACDVRVYHAPLVEDWQKQKWNFISNVNTSEGIEFGINNSCSRFPWSSCSIIVTFHLILIRKFLMFAVDYFQRKKINLATFFIFLFDVTIRTIFLFFIIIFSFRP